ncbi:MAG TPA: 2-amino-4-hydroxy-6-hydroxymethyldihydropteridine diphosphokinase [Pyrinomonadaceae bacterium]|nr:2-amino-4-hydroxy-6-hydroxymethyldihydropteridine diphosphokinase [Pyrinomonadaceae bacterium]
MTGNNGQVTAYIGLGSNLGDRAGNLLLGVRGLIEACFEVTAISCIYETEALEMDGAPDFLNMAAAVRCKEVTPTQLMARLLRIEYNLGRTDKTYRQPRTIDLDLLFFGDTRMDTPFLTLPHPRIQLRKFVLLPLNDIAPKFRHPVLGKTVEELLAAAKDDSRVVKWMPANHAGRPAAEHAGI